MGMIPKKAREKRLLNLIELKNDLDKGISVDKDVIYRLIDVLIENETLLMQLEDMAQGILLYKNIEYPIN